MGLGVGFGGRGRRDGLAATSLGSSFEAFVFHSKVSVRNVDSTKSVGSADKGFREDSVQDQAVVFQDLSLANRLNLPSLR